MSKPSNIHRFNDLRAQRTVLLVRKAVSELRRLGGRVSFQSIANESKKIDPKGRGVSPSAIRRNPEARKIYLKYTNSIKPRVRPRVANWGKELKNFKKIKDLCAKKRRLGKYLKADLIELILYLQAQNSELYQSLCQAGIKELEGK